MDSRLEEQLKDLHLTPIETKIMDILGDGLTHSGESLRSQCCHPSGIGALRKHITLLRRKLETKGITINIRVHKRKGQYQCVRLLHSPYNGRT